MSETDKECVRLCLDGRPEMFRHLVSRYENALTKHLRALVSGEDEAVEAAQEAMVRAYFSLSKLEKHDAFYPWLLGIADRVSKEVVRKRRRAMALDEGTIPDRAEIAPEHDSDGDEALRLAVAALPAPLREVIQMRFYGNQTCAEMSGNLGVSLGTVTSRLSRAYSQLRETLRLHENRAEVD